MSIFGKYIQKISDLKETELTEIQNKISILENKIKNKEDKSYVLLTVESKGALERSEKFSFGNGGKEAGFCCMKNFEVAGVSISSKKTGGLIGVGIMNHLKKMSNIWKISSSLDAVISGVVPFENSSDLYIQINLYGNEEKKYFDFEQYNEKVRFNAGDVITFISLYNNPSVTNTVVSILLKII